jgi:hypothetical protein
MEAKVREGYTTASEWDEAVGTFEWVDTVEVLLWRCKECGVRVNSDSVILHNAWHANQHGTMEHAEYAKRSRRSK